MLLSFFLIGTMHGCSIMKNPSDVKFREEVDVFYTLMQLDKSSIPDYTVNFQSLPSPAIGRCYMLTNEIQIDPDYWYRQSTYLQRKSVLYHELAHCICNLGHEEIMMKDSCPSNIMYPSIPSKKCLRKHWGKYIVKLRKACHDNRNSINIMKFFK